jgi:hypothetical protein
MHATLMSTSTSPCMQAADTKQQAQSLEINMQELMGYNQALQEQLGQLQEELQIQKLLAEEAISSQTGGAVELAQRQALVDQLQAEKLELEQRIAEHAKVRAAQAPHVCSFHASHPLLARKQTHPS